MTVMDVANRLVDLCRKGQFREAIETCYGEDVVSIEPMDMPGLPARMEGLDAIRGKNQWWTENHEVHGLEVDGPYIKGDSFIVRFGLDVTPKMTGERTRMSEVGIYTVRDGKVAQEEFYYHADAMQQA